MGVRTDGTAFGILFDTTWKAVLSSTDEKIDLKSEGIPFRVFVIDRESPQAVVRGLAELTGTMPMIPRWALGYHQCRFSYQPDSRVIEIADGKEFHGDAWPGAAAFPDFTCPKAQQWWAGLYKDFIATGIDGVWNDVNEPQINDTPNKIMPEDNIHRGGNGLPEGTHLQYHNVYGMLMVRSSREGILAARPETRPFILTRSNFLGGHRYAATWTGDNGSTWEHLKLSIPMSLTLGLSGQPVSGADILVIPAFAEKPNLPGGIWREISLVDGDQQDKYQAALKIRGGAIVPTGKIIQNTTEESLDPLTLLVSLDENGKAEGSLYWDNGDGWEYRNGEYSLQKYSARTEGNSVTVRLTGTEGSMETENKGMAIVKVITDNGIRQASGNLEEGITVRL